MTSPAVQKRIWDSLISAESRSVYFGHIASSLQAREKWLAFAVGVFSSVAFVNLISKFQVTGLSEAFSFLSAIAGVYIGLARQSKAPALAGSLCRTWGSIQDEFEYLWHQLSRLDDEEALARWKKIEKMHYDADETASQSFSKNRRLMRQSQSQVYQVRGIS